MPSFRNFGALLFLVLAIGALVASSASAARFTYNPLTGTLLGRAASTQVFTFNGGKLECLGAEAGGTIIQIGPEKQDYSVTYRECKAFGTSTVHTSQVTYGLAADGQLHIESTFKIVPTVLGMPACTLEIKPQTLKPVDYVEGSTLLATFTLTGITYTSTGGICGSSGANGTYLGSIKIERVGGGLISVDP
jgi:hypothetical protein